MDAKPQRRTYDLLSLDPVAREALLRRTHAAEARLYPSVEPFDAYAARLSGDDLAMLEVVTLEVGEAVVAYCFNIALWLEAGGERVLVARGNVGVLPGFRGGDFAARAQVTFLLRARLRYPTATFWGHAWIVSQASYVTIARRITVWPQPGTATPPAVDTLAGRLAARFGSSDASDPWHTRFEGGTVRTRRSASASARDLELARFYEAANPGHADGWALAIVIPMTLRELAVALGRVLSDAAGRALSRWLPRAPQLALEDR